MSVELSSVNRWVKAFCTRSLCVGVDRSITTLSPILVDPTATLSFSGWTSNSNGMACMILECRIGVRISILSFLYVKSGCAYLFIVFAEREFSNVHFFHIDLRRT